MKLVIATQIGEEVVVEEVSGPADIAQIGTIRSRIGKRINVVIWEDGKRVVSGVLLSLQV